MAKKTHVKVRLVPEEKPDSPFFYYVKKPVNNCHLVMDKPESVNLVKPPTMIMADIIQNILISHIDIRLLTFRFSLYING